MFFSGFTFFIFCIVALLFDSPAQCRTKDCTDKCCLFVESFPTRLKQLRTSFAKIREYYESNDDIDTALLDESVLEDFKSPFGCHAMNEVLRFYLETILPTAVQNHLEYTNPIGIIGNIFNDLKREVLTCKNHFSCKKPFSLDSIMSAYKKIPDNGLYKAMGELDLLFNYIEEYMVSKRKRQ